jgi:hypothetical protein
LATPGRIRRGGEGAALAKRLRSSQSFNTKQRTASGLGMIGLGLYVAIADNR